MGLLDLSFGVCLESSTIVDAAVIIVHVKGSTECGFILFQPWERGNIEVVHETTDRA